jgi:hypothetical protein
MAHYVWPFAGYYVPQKTFRPYGPRFRLYPLTKSVGHQTSAMSYVLPYHMYVIPAKTSAGPAEGFASY